MEWRTWSLVYLCLTVLVSQSDAAGHNPSPAHAHGAAHGGHAHSGSPPQTQVQTAQGQQAIGHANKKPPKKIFYPAEDEEDEPAPPPPPPTTKKPPGPPSTTRKPRPPPPPTSTSKDDLLGGARPKPKPDPAQKEWKGDSATHAFHQFHFQKLRRRPIWNGEQQGLASNFVQNTRLANRLANDLHSAASKQNSAIQKIFFEEEDDEALGNILLLPTRGPRKPIKFNGVHDQHN